MARSSVRFSSGRANSWRDFERVLTLVEDGCRGLLEFLMKRQTARS